MIERYKTISIVYGGSGREYAKTLNTLINEYEKENRYPLTSRIIMESILTKDILESVCKLFDETEICIAFLTLDDCCLKEDKKTYRLRQNVIFELGMALYKLGREHCILLGDFEDKLSCAELPSDISGLDIRFFNEQNRADVFNDVLKKILQLSFSEKEESNELVRYDYLLRRNAYFVDYGKMFRSYDNKLGVNKRDYLKSLLSEWLDECKSLKYFDERLIYIAERIAFMPIFGKRAEVSEWYRKIEEILGEYSGNDVDYYGGTRLLNYAKNTLSVIINYTKCKMIDGVNLDGDVYEELLTDLKLNPPPVGESVNPLLDVLYYDYSGLMYMHLYDYSHSFNDLLTAKKYYEIIIDKYLDKVDLGLNVWGGFLYYNIARLYSKILDKPDDIVTSEETINAYLQAVVIRKKWISSTGFNSMIQNALSYEYFIAKLDYIHQMRLMNIKTPAEVQSEYQKLEGEIESYCNYDEKLERLIFIQEKLRKLRSEE